MADINEQICKAVDIIVSKKLESINFDSTIIATIVDNSEAEQYKYICSNGSSQFVAYAKETNYKINESVYVTIPNNDYDQQKIIIGKYVAKDAKPYIFKQPFETIIDISGNLIKTNEVIAQSLLANNENNKEENYAEILLQDIVLSEGYAGFDRLGLQAQFRSWIASYETTIGEYGLKLYIYSDMGKTVEANKDNEKDFLDTLKITEIKFSSLNMYGNPYNFQSFMEQEAVYDISELGNIYKIKLFFYQVPKSFKDKDGNLIPYQTITKNRLPNNLFVKDPYICLGYNLSNFTDEQVILSTLDSKTYIIDDNISSSDISKYIRLRWLHKFENGDIKVVNENSKLSDYEIRWYRYELGASSADEYSGVYWEKVDDGNNNPFDYTLIPRKKHNEELIKAIVIYNGKSYTSNILTFTNEREVINDAIIDFLNGLSIVCEDNSYGNYCIYGQNNNLFDADQANRIRELQAYFGFSEQGQTSDKLQEATKIVWEFPLYNSMIVLDGYDYYKGAPLDGYYTDAIVNKDEKQGLIQIIRNPSEDGKINSKQDYRIQKTYSQTKVNNTIRCTITKNQIEYSASKDFTFGLMGTNGTDATVVIDFDDNKVALTADTPINEETGNDLGEALSLTAHLYDSTHKEIDFYNESLNLSCEWSWFYYNVGYGESVNIKEVFRSDPDGNKISINKCFLEHKKLNLNNQFLILQATIKGWGDYDLISYKAIPIRKNKQYRNYIGPTDIVYKTSGYADYYKQPFELWWCEDISNINDKDLVLDRTLTIKAENLTWQIGNPFNIDQRYIGTINNNILKPLYIYTKDTMPYSVVCLQNNETVWIQPLVIIQNEYPSTTINKWDGKELTVDYEAGYILSSAIAAGKKNSDNTFSGVMLGDWKSTDTTNDITEQTGVYGFNHGSMSYAFKEDGTAFIGKAGRGRIELDGNYGTIKSSLWTRENPIGMKIDLDDGDLQMSSDKNYKSVSNPIEKDFGKYYIEIEYKPVELNSVYNQNEIYYKPIKFSDNHRGSAINSQYFYEKITDADGKISYKRLTTFDSNKIGTYSFPIEFEQEIFYEAPENISDYYVSIDSYYILAQYKEESQSGLGLNFNSSDFTYYTPGERGYITLSAKEGTYPLGIGLSSSIYSRNFRVKWDGTCYINNGNFKGDVTADNLYCSNGEIGGWEIGRHTLSGRGGRIVLDSSDASITGGILRSSSGGITLDGYFTLNNGAYIGEMQANFGTEIDGGTGVGFSFGSAAVKATSKNVGLTNEVGFLTFTSDSNNIALAARNNGNILIYSRDTGYIQIGVMAKTNPININGDTITVKANKIVFETSGAENQTGIYARFA